MKRVLLLSSLLLLLAACSPIPYYIGVDVQKDSEYDIDLEGRSVAVIAISPAGDKDSALVSEVGMGIAEKLEADRGLASGSIPVYSVKSEDVSVNEPGSLDLVAVQTSSNLIMALDSLTVGEYFVKTGSEGEMAYSNGEFLHVTTVLLPVTAMFTVYDASSLSAVKKTLLSDTLMWSIMSERVTTDVKAIAKANTTIKKVFKEIGEEFASNFSNQWESQQRMLVTFGEEGRWMQACRYAENFKWQEAINIWLELVKTYNPKQSACAAYNIAVACEMLEKYDIALQWLEYAREKYYFRENGELKEIILKAR